MSDGGASDGEVSDGAGAAAVGDVDTVGGAVGEPVGDGCVASAPLIAQPPAPTSASVHTPAATPAAMRRRRAVALPSGFCD
ncbi:hypothetical protein ACFVUH_35645 [Kitasatospora sp. NPDC058032]|uniref:hypothetical protein n=1 Tax=Kitasatospora sp. NPDC058032 TaxID=3346307 RepID=UPI0036D94E08